ncbi:MAG TPA: DUF4445 domain-containing protein [Chloroflexi bacterium]|nr:DUF4445 domain-containing protein [Chloroflexota bacterium]
MTTLHEKPTASFTLDLEPIGLRLTAAADLTILQVVQQAGVQINAVCGGEGWCGKCRIQHMEGDLTAITDTEAEALTAHDMAQGMRLACQTSLRSDARLYLPPDSLTTAQRLQIEGEDGHIEIDPLITWFDLSLTPPTVHDLRSDATRLQDALAELGCVGAEIHFPLLTRLSNDLRENDWRIRAVVRQTREVIALLPQHTPVYGLAVDIGTTKIAGYLVDLESGDILARTGITNPQIPYGEDVVSRIQFANENTEGADILQQRLVDGVNNLISQLCQQINATPAQIVDCVFVGNTAIHHLFLGIPAAQLAQAPYVASLNEAIERRCNDMGLSAAISAYLYMPPNIAGFVGGDHSAMLLATDIVRRAVQEQQTIVAVDIGTNTEISLVHAGRLLSCSCASGPAFEGAHITHGMRAMPGAIEHVFIDQHQPAVQTIDGAAPIGICGSGILDAVAELSRIGVIDPNGQLRADVPGVTSTGTRNRQYLLVPAEQSGNGTDIIITRKDINEIQLAKGAIRAGVEVLLRECGISEQAIDRFVVAGAFGTYLDLQSAVQIGMFPPLPLERFEQVGNAAGVGAKYLLLSQNKRVHVNDILKQVEYVELTAHPEFSDIYVDALLFPENQP